MKQGFTLIELLVVVMIIGVLSAIALPQYSTAIEKSRAAEALTTMGAIRQSVERYYYSHNDSWPDAFSDLDVDVPTGKYFDYELACYGGENSCDVVAWRRDLSSGNGKYLLKTILEDNGSTITARRCCTTNEETGGGWSECTAPTAGTKAETFCNAITGGHNVDGQF